MKFVPLLLAGLIVLLIVSAVGAAVENISPQEASDLLRQNPKVFILDVRTLQEYQSSRIEGARLIPIDQITRRLGEIPADRPVLVYCAVGSRSSQVADFLDRRGYRSVYNLFGGIWGWQLAGNQTLAGGP